VTVQASQHNIVAHSHHIISIYVLLQLTIWRGPVQARTWLHFT